MLTSFGLKVGYAVHDYMMQEQRLVVDFYVSREKAIEVLHIPADRKTEVFAFPTTNDCTEYTLEFAIEA